MAYKFLTPVIDRPVMAKHPLWSRVKLPEAQHVIKYESGAYATRNTYDPDESGVAHVYMGGHVHTVDDAEAAALTAAGYGDLLTVIPDA